jgi:[ribosomal protein S18]-alanine N-acetyltransferase
MISVNNITIKDYNSKDKGRILELLRLNTPKYFDPQEEQDLLRFLEGELEEYFVVEADGAIVGCGGMNYENDLETGIISWDIFHPDYQGKSLGTQLTQFRLKKLNELETIKTIKVRTSQHTWRFYEKQGFRLLRTEENFWAPGIDLYEMIIKK